MSFLMYNDITKMSTLHRCAGEKMSRPAISIRNEGSWTFGSPSVLTEMPEKIPALFRDHMLSTVNFLAPCRLMMEMIENQVFLSQQMYARIISLGSAYEQYCICLSNRSSQPEILKVLNSRETEIACLIVDHLSNREIAEKLFLSEGTIKQYINQIYSKLMISGDTRTKRKQLIELISSIKQ